MTEYINIEDVAKILNIHEVSGRIKAAFDVVRDEIAKRDAVITKLKQHEGGE